MSVVKDTVTPQLAALIALCDDKTYTIEAKIGSSETVDKMESLAAGDRDFLQPSPRMVDSAVHAAGTNLTAQLRSGRLVDTKKLLQALGEGAWAAVLKRFKGSRDIPMRALSKSWRNYKAAHGKPTAIGIYTGDMLSDLVNATITVKEGGVAHGAPPTKTSYLAHADRHERLAAHHRAMGNTRLAEQHEAHATRYAKRAKSALHRALKPHTPKLTPEQKAARKAKANELRRFRPRKPRKPRTP